MPYETRTLVVVVHRRKNGILIIPWRKLEGYGNFQKFFLAVPISIRRPPRFRGGGGRLIPMELGGVSLKNRSFLAAFGFAARRYPPIPPCFCCLFFQRTHFEGHNHPDFRSNLVTFTAKCESASFVSSSPEFSTFDSPLFPMLSGAMKLATFT